MHLAIVTAGGAGMFCGSCMHDNTWARSLIAAGHTVTLIPTYTPLTLDERSASLQRVFLGGLNVYLNARSPWWRSLPRRLTRWVDNPALIRFATSWSISNDAQELGELTVSMLQGEHGPHQTAINELATFLARDLKPDVVIFSNALLSGAVAEIRRTWNGLVLCTLQGDDVFLDGLTEPWRTRVIALMQEKAVGFDAFLTHTAFYRDYMAKYLSLDVTKFHTLPLGLDLQQHTGVPVIGKNERYTIGYFARLSPEKGLHHFVDGLLQLQRTFPEFQAKVGGYQTPQHKAWFTRELDRLTKVGIRWENIGSPATVQEKVRFLSSLDVLSVPTEFLEPKGLPVLEALANGVPVVQPAHGAYPEILNATQGGRLVAPRDPFALAAGLQELADPQLRLQLAHHGWHGVREHYSSERMAKRTEEILQQVKVK